MKGASLESLLKHAEGRPKPRFLKCHICRLPRAVVEVVDAGWHQGVPVPAIDEWLKLQGYDVSAQGHLINHRHAGLRKAKSR